MTSPSDSPPPRRPFEDLRERESEPFYGSPEFQRIAWFVGLLVVLAIFALYALEHAQQNSAPATPPAATPSAESPPPAPTAEEIEQRKLRFLTLFEGALNDTENGQNFAETQGYRRLLQLLASYEPEEFHAKVSRELDHAAALQDPDAWRGEFVRVRGLVSGLTAVKLEPPVFGLHDVYRGALTEADATEGVIIDLIDPPPQFAMRREAVDVEGVFYRTVGYENQRGRPMTAPYVIVRNFAVVAVDEKRSTVFLRDNTVSVLIGMAVVFGLTRLLMYLFQRRARLRRPRRNPAGATDFHALFEKHVRMQDRSTGPRPPA